MANLTPPEYEFTYIDEDIEDIDFDTPADLVGITCMTAQAHRAYRIAEEFRKRGVPVVFGGIHAAVCPAEVARHCDAMVIGEAEHSWPALLEDFRHGRLKPVYRATDFPPVTELTSPRVDVIKHGFYVNFPIQATRGCPYDCDFCSIRHSAGNEYRMKPVEQIVEEIRAYEHYNDGGPAGVLHRSYFFVDDNFYVNRGYVIELLTALKELDITWHGQATVNVARDDEVLQLMAESGCRSFQFGFESLSPRSLLEANKPRVNKIEDYGVIIEKVQSHGILVGGYFIFGFDSDTIDVFESTVDFVKETKIAQPMLNILTPYPGTRLYNRMADRIIDPNWSNYNAWKSVFTPAQMTADELQFGLYWAAMQVIDMDMIRTGLENFWRQGPWSNLPTLTTTERLVLLYIAARLRRSGEKRFTRFLIWAATHPKACDFRNIMWQIMRTNQIALVRYIAFNPAERRRELAAARAAAGLTPPPDIPPEDGANGADDAVPAVAASAASPLAQSGQDSLSSPPEP
ncbi:MAG: B12-binding domain-containing radical SAM protein [Propionibacteriaceae bacterium]|nr:B12-binding domain-containing radical SAM protein [Propionibacteriaceae bacterium]